MDKINDQQTRNSVFTAAHNHIRNGDINAAAEVYSEALKTFANDEGIMSDLAMAFALEGNPDKLSQAVALCERVLSGNGSDKVHHTTRAALCFIYMKAGEKEKAVAIAQRLPHLRESREFIQARINGELSNDDINSNIKLIGFGKFNEQDIIEVDFGINMVSVCTEHDLIGKINILRNEVNAPPTNEGYRILPQIRVKDNCSLSLNQVRVRSYIDYLLDNEFDNPSEAVDKIIESLRTLAQKINAVRRKIYVKTETQI